MGRLKSVETEHCHFYSAHALCDYAVRNHSICDASLLSREGPQLIGLRRSILVGPERVDFLYSRLTFCTRMTNWAKLLEPMPEKEPQQSGFLVNQSLVLGKRMAFARLCEGELSAPSV
jgi:hypothetical protein